MKTSRGETSVQQSSNGRLLSIRDAASYLGMDEKKLRQQVRNRRVRFLRLGRSIQIYEKWLDEFIAANTFDATGNNRGALTEDEILPSRVVDIRDLVPKKSLLGN